PAPSLHAHHTSYTSPSPHTHAPLFPSYPPYAHPHLHSFPTRRSSDLNAIVAPSASLFSNEATSSQASERGPPSLSRSLVASASGDRKSTRLNSSHQIISYAVFCLKKKKTHRTKCTRHAKSTSRGL